MLRVGDTVSYSLSGGVGESEESSWRIDPSQGGLKSGFLFRNGKLFTPLAPGELSLPPLPIVNAAGEVVGKTKEIKITIASNFSEKDRASGKPPTPEPAMGPFHLSFPAWIQSAIALSVLGIALLLAFFLIRFLKRKAAAALKKILPPKPYDTLSLERIDSLLKQGLLEAGKFKPFYFTISEVLKFYLGERFGFDAQESTTSELVTLLKEKSGMSDLSPEIVRRIEKLFETLDPVKFANVIPSTQEAKNALKEARDIISTTRKMSYEPLLKERK